MCNTGLLRHEAEIQPQLGDTRLQELRNSPMGSTPHKAVTNHFPQSGEIELQRLQGHFQPQSSGRRHGNPV